MMALLRQVRQRSAVSTSGRWVFPTNRKWFFAVDDFDARAVPRVAATSSDPSVDPSKFVLVVRALTVSETASAAPAEVKGILNTSPWKAGTQMAGRSVLAEYLCWAVMNAGSERVEVSPRRQDAGAFGGIRAMAAVRVLALDGFACVW